MVYYTRIFLILFPHHIYIYIYIYIYVSYIRVWSILYTLTHALIWGQRKSLLYPSFFYIRVSYFRVSYIRVTLYIFFLYKFHTHIFVYIYVYKSLAPQTHTHTHTHIYIYIYIGGLNHPNLSIRHLGVANLSDLFKRHSLMDNSVISLRSS